MQHTLVLVFLALLPATTAQSVFKVSRQFDDRSAPAAGSIAGIGSSLRQQIILDESRIAPLRNKDLTALLVRRDLDFTQALAGGDVQLEVFVGPARQPAARTSTQFAQNATSRTRVYRGVVTLPASPATSAGLPLWGAKNSVRIPFTTAYRYTGGPLCFEIVGHPIPGRAPSYWAMDHETAGAEGREVVHGTSCSPFASAGKSLSAESSSFMVGSSMRLIAFGRPGSVPMLLLGARPIVGGFDLSATGAVGCRQYVDYFLSLRLQYHPPTQAMSAGFLNFRAQIPAQGALMGRSLFFQFADLETLLPRREWTNPAGLTTSNGIEVQVSAHAPSLGMAVVRSRVVASSTAPLPATGAVDVHAAPVLRFEYR